MPLDLTSLEKAVTALGAVIIRAEDASLMSRLDETTRQAVRSGVIQHFEFTFELCWKFMQRWLRENSAPEDADLPRTRKDLFRLAAHHGLITDPVPWFGYAEARNLTSHTYDLDRAAVVYTAALDFAPAAAAFSRRLAERND
jgi:nucleotidyltransferase substrate binding protein (TIGR01987 family)